MTMKAFLIWCGITAALLAATLFFHMPEWSPWKPVLGGTLFLLTVGFIAHISKEPNQK